MRTVLIPTVDDAYERWSYGEGWTAGRVDGLRDGFAEGYAAGFDGGAEVGGARVLLELEHVVGREELMRDVDGRVPHVVAWLDHRNRTVDTDDGCAAGCGRCSRCIRTAAVADNVARYGQADFPGGHHPATSEDGWC